MSKITFAQIEKENQERLNSNINKNLESVLEISHEENIKSQKRIDSVERANMKQSKYFRTKTDTLLTEVLPSRKWTMYNASPFALNTYINITKECPSALKVFKAHIDNSYVNQSFLTYNKLEEITGLSRTTIAKCQKYLYDHNMIYYMKKEAIEEDGSSVDINTYFINPDFVWNSDPANIFAFPKSVLNHFGIYGLENLKRKFNHYVSIDNHKIVNTFLMNIAKTKTQGFNFIFMLSLLMNKWGSVSKSQKELSELLKCSIRKIQELLKFLKEQGLLRITRNDKFIFALLKQDKINKVSYHNKYEVNATVFWKTNTRADFMFIDDITGVRKQWENASDAYYEKKKQAA